MNLTIERATLLRSLTHVQSVVERRNTIPILSNLLIEAGDGSLRLTATDMDLTIIEGTGAQVQEPGGTTAPAHTLYDIVRKLPEGCEVALKTGGTDGMLTLVSGASHFSLATLPKEDFPVAGESELTTSFSLQPGEARNLIDRTRFAISMEETRYYLNGIYLHAATSVEVPVLRAVATDGHRLARFEMPLPDGAAGMPEVIVPRKTIAELRKLLEDVEEPVHVTLSDTRIRFSFADVVLTSKLIDGTFPDYERVIPKGNDKLVEVDRKSFTEAVDRVSTVSTEKSRAIKLSLGDGHLTLSADSPESGSGEEEVPIKYEGPELEIGFNWRYLLDVTQQIEGDGAEFAIADASSPTLVRDVADSSAIYVLMPMRV